LYRDLWTFLWSRKLATILLVFLILLATIGATVPQQSVYSAAEFVRWQQDNPLFARLAINFKLTRLLESSLFIGCSLMLCLSLLLCSARRAILLVMGREEKITLDELVIAPQNRADIEAPLRADQVLEIISFQLRKKRFSCSFSDSQSLQAVRGRWGALGSLLFHFSFLVLLVGAITSTWARLEGTFILTEGQSFRGLPGEYALSRRAPLLVQDSLPFQFNFEQLRRVDEPEINYHNRVSLQEESGERLDALIRPFHALTYRGYTFYQSDHGFSPALVFTNKQGRVLLNAFVAMQTKRQGDDVHYEDYFKVPGVQMHTQLNLFPDADFENGVLVNRSEYPDNPIIAVKVMVGDNIFYDGSVRLDETIDAGNFTIEFKEVRYWSGFRVVKDNGLPLIYGSFVIGILGYFLRLFFIREMINVKVGSRAEGCLVTISGSTEMNEALFSEKFADIVSTLRQGVAKA